MHKITELVRGLVRPTIAWIAVLATIAFIVAGTYMPDRWWDIVVMVIGLYFGSRAAEKASGRTQESA